MSCSYTAYLKDGRVENYPDTVCYSPWYYSNDQVKTWDVYMPVKDQPCFMNSYCEDKQVLTPSEVQKYLMMLQKMGFAFTYEDVAEREGRNGKKGPATKITLHSDQNSPIGTLLALNAFRYTWEAPMSDQVPQDLLKWGSLTDAPHELFNKFTLAHHRAGNKVQNIHSIYQHYHVLYPLTADEFVENVLKFDKRVTHTNQSLIHTKPPAKVAPKLDRMFALIAAGEIDAALEAYNAYRPK